VRWGGAITSESKSRLIALSALDTRVPNWGCHSLEERVCPFCHTHGDPRYARADGLTICACYSCGAFFISPCPSEQQIADFYQHYFTMHRTCGGLDSYAARRLLATDPYADPLVSELASIMDLKGKRILEVGCGRGTNLVKFKKLGARVEGIDPDPDAVTFVREKLGIQSVAQGTLSDVIPEHVYDAVLLVDVIEHLYYPFGTLEQAMLKLNRGGVLAILTPNASSALLDPAPLLFRVDFEHLQYLSRRTCSFIAAALGVDLIHLECLGFPDFHSLHTVQHPAPFEGMRRLVGSIAVAVRRIPGFYALNRARRAALTQGERCGSYSLLCLYQK
jgi:2-polyprenyl-3-methyl-5-hydroxy-6-metoxy-1,4-benzoquinol methylase